MTKARKGGKVENMRRTKQEDIPADIAKMTVAECKAEQERMRNSGEFDHAIEERDRWQAVLEAWNHRIYLLDRRMVEVLRATHPESD